MGGPACLDRACGKVCAPCQRRSPSEARPSTAALRDTGIGVPAEKLQLIFEAFTQADSSTTRRHGGAGLGLSISSRLAQMMGGRIWAESEAGKGSSFHVLVRLGVQPEEAAAQGVSRGAEREAH